MSFQGFQSSDFDTFHIDGLDERMEAIQERIQPKFKEIGDFLTDELSMMLGKEMYLHIAKHARRTKNPPTDTWLGIADNKRGYKKHPHFQVGLFDDHVFLWLAYIYEMPDKQEVAKSFLENKEDILSLPDDYVISLDHTKKDAFSINEIAEDKLTESLTRFRDVKKGEFLIGKHIKKDDPLLKDGEAFLQEAKQTFETLVPFYELSINQTS
ncbi:YktB family protein [Alteribacillus sp. JSM 102045]|uniref:YktB family protein n=1 Tax=Alteribacillus sp. JSM 102045 TaxID=1562101 RepID=UPI0035C18C14